MAQFKIARNSIVSELWNEKLPAGFELTACSDPELEYASLENKDGDSFNWEIVIDEQGAIVVFEYVYVGDQEQTDDVKVASFQDAIIWIKQRIRTLSDNF